LPCFYTRGNGRATTCFLSGWSRLRRGKWRILARILLGFDRGIVEEPLEAL
jgi:hypothetical protein